MVIRYRLEFSQSLNLTNLGIVKEYDKEQFPGNSKLHREVLSKLKRLYKFFIKAQNSILFYPF